MRLFILGATGGIGGQLVEQALSRNHDVTAFVRSPQKIARTQERLTVVAGDPLNRDQLGQALPGHDAVLSALGPRVAGAATVHRDFARSVIPAMENARVRRLLVVSTAFLFSDAWLPSLFGRLFFKEVVKDTGAMERIITASSLEWTIVRPPRLTDGPRTEHYRIQDGHLPPRGMAISRADVAHFMLDEVQTSMHLRKVVGISR